MTSDWLGGGLIIGIAAVLWLIYLLPTCFRRNEYIATERNVVRLQQTLRILAETAEAPEEVRAEASARSVVEHQRMLKKVIVNNIPPAISASRKLRKARAVTSVIFVVSLVFSVFGGIQIAVNGAWIVLVIAGLSSVLCVTRLVRLAKLGRAIRIPAPAAAGISAGVAGMEGFGAVDESADFDDSLFAELEDAQTDSSATSSSDGSTWTPVPLPKPLYAGSRSFVAADSSLSYAELTATQAEDALRLAARQSEAALRAAQHAYEATHPLYAVAAGAGSGAGSNSGASSTGAAGATGTGGMGGTATHASAPADVAAQPSRFSQMGIVDDTDTGSLDVDHILARRRAV